MDEDDNVVPLKPTDDPVGYVQVDGVKVLSFADPDGVSVFEIDQTHGAFYRDGYEVAMCNISIDPWNMTVDLVDGDQEGYIRCRRLGEDAWMGVIHLSPDQTPPPTSDTEPT